MTNEALIYYQIGMLDDPDMLKDCLTIKPALPDACQLVAEQAYIYEQSAVPDWAIFIESFEYFPESDSYVFVHRDPDTA